MSRLCGHPLDGKQTCRHRVADPARPDCGRHSAGDVRTAKVLVALDERGCRMQEHAPGAWRCLTHGDDPEWEAAQALGATPPCQVPGDFDTRLRAAQQEPLDAGTAALLAGDLSPVVRWRLTDNTAAVGSALAQLARDPSRQVRWNMASNTAAPRLVLELLAQDPSKHVRQGVAGNRSTPGPVLQILAQDPDREVRQGVAWNPNTPKSVLELLAQDPDEGVRRAAVEAQA